MTQHTLGFYYHTTAVQDSLSLTEGQSLNANEAITPFRVYHDIADIIVTQWPGTLWFVEAIPTVDHPAHSKENTFVSTELKLIKKLPCSLLFGTQGTDVCLLLNKILQLTSAHIEQLSSLATPMATQAYMDTWSNWLKQTDNHPMHLEADHSGTLAIGEGENSSPIYSGFLTINELVQQRASQLEGKEGVITQTIQGEVITSLTPRWNQACSVLLQAAMGLGAPHYVPHHQLESLLSGWHFLCQTFPEEDNAADTAS